jgi:hypothetical protein
MSKFEDYANKYRTIRMERRNGILQMTLHPDGGKAVTASRGCARSREAPRRGPGGPSGHLAGQHAQDRGDFMVFDCPYARNKDLRKQPLYVRRNVIEDVLDEQDDLVLPVRRLSDHGLKAWEQVLEHGYEGLVAKDPQAPSSGSR